MSPASRLVLTADSSGPGMEDEKVLLWDAIIRARIGTKPVCEFDNPKPLGGRKLALLAAFSAAAGFRG